MGADGKGVTVTVITAVGLPEVGINVAVVVAEVVAGVSVMLK